MAEIRALVLTFLERLSHNALPKNRKRETLDACIRLKMRDIQRAAKICKLDKKVTGLRDSHTRVIASKSIGRTSISFKDLPLFCML